MRRKTALFCPAKRTGLFLCTGRFRPYVRARRRVIGTAATANADDCQADCHTRTQNHAHNTRFLNKRIFEPFFETFHTLYYLQNISFIYYIKFLTIFITQSSRANRF